MRVVEFKLAGLMRTKTQGNWFLGSNCIQADRTIKYNAIKESGEIMTPEHQAAKGLATLMGFGFIWISMMFAAFITWVYSLIEILKSEFKSQNGKIVWLLILIFLGPLGLLLYWVIGRKDRIQ